MYHFNVFAYGVEDILREISKKGTESDIRLYNRKEEDGVMTFIEPIKYPDKISSLTDSIYPTDIFIINGDNLDKYFAETVIALDLFGKRRGIIVAQEDKQNTIRKLLKDTQLQPEFFSGRPMEIIDKIKAINIERSDQGSLVVIDHYFKVKSVGTVVLGFVLSGKIKKHQDLYLSEINRQVQIRSIQVNDVDFEEAEAGTRVGLALKNVEVEELSRGMFLSDKPFEYTNQVEDNVVFHKSLKGKDTLSDPYISDLMNFVKCNAEGDSYTTRLKIPIIKDSLILADQNGFPRVVGYSKIRR
ncbi:MULTISPECIES: EF-Tu/IF-2/RF-3 family GTPase [unclassified Thermoplasma]|uniref:selenocysteine-specific translation elongation factor n=1 Tax=unclassified Thermoplasma TaxID=2684908 RepID=UPI000D823DEE|nr:MULTISPECIES: EF-Tu/IF-2/RF-3 family GTPase [unclassified Thermoplasma]PYB67691.1 GTPase [Thermoplasma sp. Kam2015]